MSIPGFYTQQQFEDSFNEGRRKGLIGGIVIGFAVGCAATAFYCYQQYGPPAQVPNLALLIGDLRHAKDDCEGIVNSVKNRWSAKLISDAIVRAGASDYRDLASRFNGISASLEAMLSTGHDEKSREELQSNLIDAQNRYYAFRAWFNKLPREKPVLQPRSTGHSPDEVATGETKYEALPEIGIDLAKHFFDGIKEMDKLKREHLINMLRSVQFKQWPEIPGDVPRR